MKRALQSSLTILVGKYEGKVCFGARRYKWEDKKLSY
jgi:hypothetical protein